MSARESGAPEGIKVEQYRALVLTESPQTVLASTGNLIFLTAVKSESVAIVVVAYPPPIFDFPGDNYIQMFYRKKKKSYTSFDTAFATSFVSFLAKSEW